MPHMPKCHICQNVNAQIVKQRCQMPNAKIPHMPHSQNAKMPKFIQVASNNTKLLCCCCCCCAQVEYAFSSQKIHVDSMESDPITFAGLGDPILEVRNPCQMPMPMPMAMPNLPMPHANANVNANNHFCICYLQLDTIAEAVQSIKARRHGQSFRVATSGLVSAEDLPRVVDTLKVCQQVQNQFCCSGIWCLRFVKSYFCPLSSCVAVHSKPLHPMARHLLVHSID